MQNSTDRISIKRLQLKNKQHHFNLNNFLYHYPKQDINIQQPYSDTRETLGKTIVQFDIDLANFAALQQLINLNSKAILLKILILRYY